MENIIRNDIMAIVPEYIHNKGNCTRIYTRAGIFEVEKTIKTVIRNISNYYHLDLKQSNITCKKIFYTKKNLPIPFTPNDIFIMVKTRKPLFKDDGAYGYVRINTIKNIVFEKDKDLNPRIIFDNKESLEVLCTLRTLYKNLKNGEIIEMLLNQKYATIVREPYSIYFDEDKPATKKDISLLCMEILKLKR